MIALILLAAIAAPAEPIEAKHLDDWYAARAAEGLPPRKPFLVFGDRMKVGHVGRVPPGTPKGEHTPYYGLRVLQVVGETELLVEVTIMEWRSVFSGEGAYARPLGWQPKPIGETYVWVRGIETEGVVDGKRFELPGDWTVAGTQAYESAAGQRTVFTLEPTEIPAPPARAEPPPAPAPAEVSGANAHREPEPEPEPKPAFREWSDASGRFTVRAEFRGYVAGEVKLRTEDGRDIAVPLSRLSIADQDHVRSKGR